ncbi:hypothetical protein G7046_g2145 [Stylonectria norvegica]|nr:hypothetical protein G7046_g2145 [Stylonectria norvegica]
MFGNFSAFATLPSKVKTDPKDVPPPTPITLPRYQPFAHDDDPINPSDALPSLLKRTGRPTALLGPVGFSALGVNLNLDSKLEDIVPDPSYIPDFGKWEKLTADEAQDQNHGTRRPMRTGNSTPGCQVYLERKKELSHANEDAFRTVRRMQPPKGKQQARLGNTYEFFRSLEALTTFWDDPTQPPELPLSPEMAPEATTTEAATDSDDAKKESGAKEDDPHPMLRIAAGSAMPAEFRNSLVTSFIKLVAYDFGSNVAPSRVEPRLHLSSSKGSMPPRKTYCPSGCVFVFQSPMTREAARAGMVYGPLAAVSARGTTDFTTPDLETAQSHDLAREMVAALITAQHRAREGKTETRFGDGQWWTTAKRWGGGTGGPIGRETDKNAAQGDKDAKPSDSNEETMPVAKKARKNMSVYDNYRMIRPPSSTWDRKAVYTRIGRQKGTDYDDVFVISSLFHHISVLRVRVPNRLLEVLDGEDEPNLSKRSWGKVESWRSPWYDLFEIDQRVAAMQMVWGVMAYQMRKDTGTEQEDIKMVNA